MISTGLITKILAKMQKYFGKYLEVDVLQIYIENLQKMKESDFKIACVRIMQEFCQTSVQPFPLIKDFLEMSGQDGRTRAVNVVAIVREAMEAKGQYESVDFQDQALHCVIQRYGGWPEMVNNNTDKWWSLHERNFIQAYESARRSGLPGPNRLLGVHEAENTMNGYTPERLIEMGIKPKTCGFGKNKTELKKIENEPRHISNILRSTERYQNLKEEKTA